VIIGGREVRVFGSLWRFIFNYLSRERVDEERAKYMTEAVWGRLKVENLGL